MEFELSYKNKRIKMWLIWVIPIVLLSILLFFLLPIEYHLIPTLLPIVTVFIFIGWILYDKGKHKK